MTLRVQYSYKMQIHIDISLQYCNEYCIIISLVKFVHYISGLMLERRNSIAKAMELGLSCILPSTCYKYQDMIVPYSMEDVMVNQNQFPL